MKIENSTVAKAELPILPFGSSSNYSRLTRVPQIYWVKDQPHAATEINLPQLCCRRNEAVAIRLNSETTARGILN